MARNDHRGNRRQLPAWVRAEVATRLGVAPGERAIVGCHYCGDEGSMVWFFRERDRTGWVDVRGLEWDHVTPVSRGGTNDPDNIVLACNPCNRSKGCKTLDNWAVPA